MSNADFRPVSQSAPHNDDDRGSSDVRVLTLSCPDKPGIVHAVSGVLADHGCNIIESSQYSSPATGTFFMRVSVQSTEDTDSLREALAPIATQFSMQYRFKDLAVPVRTLVMVSRDGHCLNDLLFAQRSGLLNIEIPAIVSNHDSLRELAEFYGVPFYHFPVAPGAEAASSKAEAEAKLLALVEELDVELVVLARYMQILSDQLCGELEGRAINIHHSFLPSFKGAKPYHQAWERGVKLIGATAHYVTAALDEGPIIEQEVIRVNHARTPGQFVAMGKDVEARTLRQAVQWHTDQRVLLDGHRTVVFP